MTTSADAASEEKYSGTKSLTVVGVAITAKLVLALIRAHIDGDNTKFQQEAVNVAEELTLNGEEELSLWILAQFHLVRTFEVTD